MRPQVAAVCILLWVGLQGCGGRSRSGVFVSADQSNRPNPVKATPSVIAEGRRIYLKSDCVMCHGVGYKDAVVAPTGIGPNCDAWTDTTSVKDYTDGELAYVVNRGKGNMLGYERKLTPDEVWKVVDYVRACGR